MSGSSTSVSDLLARIRPFTNGDDHLKTRTKLGQTNPIGLCNEDLKSYGLPAKPQGPLLQNWKDIFGQPLTFMPFRAIDPSAQKIPWVSVPKSNRSAKSVAPNRFERYETSLNWSGAYLLPTPGKRFVQVWGRWVVPKVEAPDDQYSETEYHCSTWIGLDGQRQYANSTLPQIGTLQKVKFGQKPQTTAWVQWWQRDDNRSTPVTLDFPVEALDEVSCVLTVLTEPNEASQQYEQSVLFTIVARNETKNNVMSVRIDPPMIKEGGTSRLWIPGATAEWVMERPAILKQKTLEELADYHTTRFYGCNAAEATETSPDEQTRLKLDSPWFIRMYEIRDSRISYISNPTRSDDTSFDVIFGN